jgi:riboflavin kinase / FMN adenylyltransferase
VKIFPGASAVAADRSWGGPRPPVSVAIGNFDGVHRGHQALLAEARARAAARGGASAVLTFTPHPARLLAPDRAPPLIMSLDRRLELIADAGIELAIVEPFTRAFAATSAEDFVVDVLARDLGARDAVVGYDFRFGRGRSGDTKRLGELGAPLGVDVSVIPPVTVGSGTCTSTKVRDLVATGHAADAAALLGRPFEIEGRVVRGAGRGRRLGFPTANVAPDGELSPLIGIYAARARVLDGGGSAKLHLAALSVGRNPTFADGNANSPVTIEAYLLDFDDDLYGRRVRIEVGERLRDEQRFDSVGALVAQIETDVARVRAVGF